MVVAAYVYKAKSGPDQAVEGEIEADSDADAVVRIERMGYSPVWVREKESGARAGRRRPPRRISRRDVTVFTSQLASLTRSAVPILRALSTIAQQTENPALARVVQDIERTIRDGHMLSDALSRHPRLFPPLYVSMVRSGESGGVMDVILARLTEAREREDDMRRRVQAALAYPLLILVTGVATVLALLTFFLPRVVALFRDYDRLPLPTRILIALSDFFAAWWYWLVIAALLAAAVLFRLASVPAGRQWLDSLKLRIPLMRRMLLYSDLSRYSRTLALLVDAGISIDRALALASSTVRNRVLRLQLEGARDSTIRQGRALSEGLRRAPDVPPFLVNLVAVGEEGGRLPEALTDVAVFYEKELDQQGRLVTSLLEPILILTVGALVGFIVAAMLLPIFELGTGLR